MIKNYLLLTALFFIQGFGLAAYAQDDTVKFPTWSEPPKTPSINESANAAAAAQAAAAQHNQLVALLCFQECYKSKNNMYCIMGMLALQQAAHTGGASRESGKTADASTYDTEAGGKAEYKLNTQDPRIEKGKEMLKKAGISVDTDGNVKMADGKILPASTFNSPQSMASAGLQPVSFDKIIPKSDEKTATPSAIGMGVAEGSGGGMRLPASSEPISFGHLSAEEKRRMVAGKTVMYDGEPIGVSRDNIFEKIHAIYQKKKIENHFILSNRGK